MPLEDGDVERLITESGVGKRTADKLRGAAKKLQSPESSNPASKSPKGHGATALNRTPMRQI